MLEDFASLARALVALAATFDPSSLDGASARESVRCLAEIERVAGTAKVLATARLVETGAGPGDDSFRDVDAWLASLSGTTVGAARGVVETARRVQRLPATADALRSGALSATQAAVLGEAARADPTSETRLLELATTSGVKGLRAECDRVVAAAMSHPREVDRYEHVRANRALRRRSLSDGSDVLEARGPADRIAQVMAALEPFERELFETARRNKQIEHPVVLHVSHDAYVRGHTSRARSARSRAPGRCRSEWPAGTRPTASWRPS
ncbi:MAG: hypothetical protein ACXVK4_03655 [Acidimicrobiia bacterium]